MKIPVVITTDSSKRGVFMGLVDSNELEKAFSTKEEVTLKAEEVRMAVYWSTDVKGVIALASTGPTSNCRITSAAPKAIIKGVSAVLEMTPAALKAWRKEPWKD
jgi:hypothetical protein